MKNVCSHRSFSAAVGGRKAQQRYPRAGAAATERQNSLSWAAEGGGRFDNVELATFKGLRGLKATTTIKEGEDVVFMPRKLVLWTFNGARCPFSDWIDADYFKRSSWSVKLALMLLHEQRQGSESKIYGYVSALPETIDLPYFWSEAERERLASANLRRRVEEQAVAWGRWYSDLMESSPSCGLSQAEFDWALSSVCSRAYKGPFIGSTMQDRLNVLLVVAGATALSLTFGLFPEDRTVNAALSAILFNFLYELFLSNKQRQYALCPVIDFANHSSTIDSEVSYNYFRDGYLVVAGKQFARGEQVYISYGAQTTDSMMQYYGFVDPQDNPDDVYTFVNVLSALQEVINVSPARRHAFRLDRDLAGALDTVAMNDKAQIQDDVKTALRFLLSVSNTLEGARDQGPDKAEAVVWRAMLAVAESERKAMGRPAAEDLRAAKAAAKSGQEREAVLQRYNAAKKSFLDARIKQLQKRVEQLLARS